MVAKEATAKSAEEKKQAKADEEARLANEKAQEKREEETRLTAASVTAAEQEAKATAELREVKQAEGVQELKDEVAEGSDSDSWEGQSVSNEYWTATTLRRGVEIKPVGWVGEGITVAAADIEGLKKLLGELKHLPEQR